MRAAWASTLLVARCAGLGTLHGVTLTGPAPTADWYQRTFGVAADGADVRFADGFRLRFDADGPAPTPKGCLGVGVEVPDAAALALVGGDAERLSLTASLVPDEDAEKTETLFDVAELEDPAGRRVWAGAAAGGAPAPASPAAKVVLKVRDLDAAVDFYTTALGMTLLRRRSLVPAVAAIVAFVGFSEDQAGVESGASGAARLELRYVFGSEAVEPDARVEVVADPDACAIRAGICGGTVAARGDGTVTLTDPDGYSVTVAGDAAAFEG